jgi:hypothetical protein
MVGENISKSYWEPTRLMVHDHPNRSHQVAKSYQYPAMTKYIPRTINTSTTAQSPLTSEQDAVPGLVHRAQDLRELALRVLHAVPLVHDDVLPGQLAQRALRSYNETKTG